jgi:hypothetical protein
VPHVSLILRDMGIFRYRTAPSVTSHFLQSSRILESTEMPSPSPQHAVRRAPRTCFAETTPAVLRFHNGCRARARLQVISVTGGLLSLSKLLYQGSRVKLMFLTQHGSVLGAAEMLSPINWGLQPFKFTRLHDDDEERLQAAIQSSLDQNRRSQAQVERSRAW